LTWHFLAFDDLKRKKGQGNKKKRQKVFNWEVYSFGNCVSRKNNQKLGSFGAHETAALTGQ